MMGGRELYKRSRHGPIIPKQVSIYISLARHRHLTDCSYRQTNGVSSLCGECIQEGGRKKDQEMGLEQSRGIFIESSVHK